MSADGTDWIEALPAELGGQRSLLRRLLEQCRADQRIRWLAIACSLGRGNADRLSDLDLAIGVSDADFDAALPDVRRIVDGLGELVDSYQHQIPGRNVLHERIFAQYADRCQVDLVVFRASQDMSSVKDVVVLYDPDEHIGPAFEPQPVTPEQVMEWAFAAWCALIDLGKYLRRGSWWEALQRLNDARSQTWNLWAVALGVPNPGYGLTSILDFAPGRLPPAMTGTVGDLDPDRLLATARNLADQVHAACGALPAGLRTMLPEAMGHYVTEDLACLAHAGRLGPPQP
jgi:hypothetical protein